MSNRTTRSNLINYYDDELDQVIADAIEQFAQCNIRFKSPNRTAGPTYQQKYLKSDRSESA